MTALRTGVGTGVGTRLRTVLVYATVPVALLVAWAGSSTVFDLPSTLAPSPQRVLRTAVDMLTTADLWRNVGSSMWKLFVGSAAGIVTGIALGVAAGLSERVATALRPLSSFFSGISGLIWIPLAFAWFGTGLAMSTFLIWNAVFFVVFFNVLQGVQQVPELYTSAIYTLGGDRSDVIRGAILPGAMPSMITGVRVGMGFAWRALIAAEFLGSPIGLGHMIFTAASFHRTDIVVFGALLIGVLGLLLDRLVFETWERRTAVRWGTMETGR